MLKNKENLNGEENKSFKCAFHDDGDELLAMITDTHLTTNTHTELLNKTANILETVQSKLIDTVIGKRQVPLEVVLVLIIFYAMWNIVLEVKESNIHVKINWTDGFEISNTKGDR